jgi:AcrR family transcriptional regulator
MIDAAERLFYIKGLESVSMDGIAAEAQFTKRTLYQYFTGKEDLYFAVALKGFRQMSEYCRDGFEKGQTGFEKLVHGIHAYYRFAVEHPQTFRLISYAGPQIRKTKSSPRLTEWLSFDDQLFRNVGDVVELGKQDGSIRKDIDAMQATFAMVFMATGFLRLLSETGANFAAHFDLDLDAFSEYPLSLLIDSLRPTEERNQ